MSSNRISTTLRLAPSEYARLFAPGGREVAEPGLPLPSTVLDLFRRGLDTRQIGKKFNQTEANILRVLHTAMDAERLR